MQKQIIFTIIVFLVVGAGASVYLLSQRKNVTSSPIALESKQSTATNVNPSQKLRQYTDESGFTFSYPEDLTLKKNDIKDARVYANITLASTRLGGSVSVKVSDTPFTSLESWAKAQKEVTSPREAKIGELEAYEIITPAKRITAAIDQGILFLIETVFEGKEPFWSRVHSEIISTFTFASSAESGQGVSTSSDEISIEEEIIE